MTSGVLTRLLTAALLCLHLPAIARAQTGPVLEHTGDLVFSDEDGDSILVQRFLEGENRLILVGRKTVRVADTSNAKFLETRTLEMQDFKEEAPRVISPDGRRMLVFGSYNPSRGAAKGKAPASVWDLQTGRQVALLDRTTRPIRAGVWSENGKTLATSSDRDAPFYAFSPRVEVAFWDGETFRYKNSLPSERAAWWRLSPDGGECLYSSNSTTNIIISTLVSTTGPLAVWDIGGGRVEQTITAADGDRERKIRDISVSPDMRLLALVVQPPKAKDADRRLAVWELTADGSPGFALRPKYEIKPSPKIYEYGPTFSPDSKLLSFPAGKTLQIYDAQTGEKTRELPGDTRPAYWLDDNRVLLFSDGSWLEAVEVATGRPLYQQKLIRVYTTSTDINGQEETYPLDTTTIVPRPGADVFITYSNQYVKLFDARSGRLLRTLVEPAMDYTRKKPRLSDKPLVSEAGWSRDGRTLYVIGKDRRTVSLWRLLKS